VRVLEINFKTFDAFQLDVFKEVSNIAAGNAATSLSKLLGTKINLSVPNLKILEFNEVASVLGNEEDLVAGVITPIVGEVRGMILFVLQYQDALNIMHILTGKHYPTLDSLDELAISAIRETGNILSGTYISALSKLSGLKVSCMHPNVSFDMAGAILSMPAISFAEISDNVLYIDSGFHADDGKESSKINANILLVPDSDFFKKILQALGVVK
jgi:chemotaxis protein CheC